MHLGRYGITNALFQILNAGNPNDGDVVIARYLLQNINRLDDVTIYDIAEACYTTRQSVSRFFKRLGLVNLRTYRHEQVLGEYYDSTPDVDDYPGYLAYGISEMALDINACASSYLDRFADQLHRAHDCVFLVSDIYSAACLDFQKQMMAAGKIVRVVSSGFQEKGLPECLGPNDMAIVVSVSGGWANGLREAIEGTSAWRVLLTAQHDERLLFEFDDVYYVSSTDKPRVRTVYHQFAIPYVLDLLQKRYRDQFKV